MLTWNKQSRGISETNTHHRAHSPSAESMASEVLETLKNIDLQHEAELQQLANSNTDEDLKNQIRAKLVAKYREKREPYADLLIELRKHSTTSRS